MKAIIVEPDARPRVADIHSDLHSLQKLVGGNIETVYAHDDSSCLIVSEEGKLIPMQPNRALRDPNGNIIDILFGCMLVVGISDSGNDFCDLTDEQVDKYMKMYHNKEMFIRKGDRIISFAV